MCLCRPCKTCNGNTRHYPQTEEELIQEVKKDLNLLERNPKADNDFPAIKDFWDLIYKSKYLKMPAFTSLLTELNKASERVLNLLREHNPRPKSLPHANLISAIKELMKTFVHHTTLHPNKVKTPKLGFLKFRM